ncbi:MAG: phosphatidylserine decarboxylase [Candidatus Paracaedibacteraceae bacterium]|nr:phosphatidylserine decarboxylase [Candidatus Paracaedibacteraceae bacterium]
MFDRFLVPIHREGWPFVAIFAGVTFIMALMSTFLGFVGAILTVWCYAFFRDPERVTPVGDNWIVSPADGVVTAVEVVTVPDELELKEKSCTRISIFLSVFDVHINRVPCSGEIKKIWYYPGTFLNASLDKASELNERQAFKIVTHDNKEVGFVQIAGLIARRIVSFVKEGDKMLTGQRFGLIRFGSRMDVYLPKDVAPLVVKGQKMVAGETVLADMSAKEVGREGQIR